MAERSKALRQGRNLFGGVGSNPTLVTFSTRQDKTRQDKTRQDKSRVAQWSARWAHNPQVVGSKPTSATFLENKRRQDKTRQDKTRHDKIFRSIEVSIPACHAGDPGSIPGGRAFCRHEHHYVAYRFRAHHCRRFKCSAHLRARAKQQNVQTMVLPGFDPGDSHLHQRMRPYSGEYTPSRPIWEVKHRQACLVLQ